MNVRSRFRIAAVLIGVLAASILLSGCVNNANFIDPSGPVALQESNLFWFIFYVATFIFIVVTAVLMISIFRFRARPGEQRTPRQLHGNTTIEIAWTVAPSIFLFAVLAGTIFTMFNLGQPTDTPDVTVEGIGHQWWWEFRYPDRGNIVTADEIHIPVGKVVRVELRSNNVIHGFWVPSLAGKMDVIPGQQNATWLKADRAGEYRGECTEFCGEQHAHMNFVVVAEDQSTFDSWVSQQQQQASTPSGGAALAGQQLFNQRCYTCHAINGGKQPPSAPIGPNLTHFGSRKVIAGGVLNNTPDDLKKWIHNTQDWKPGNDMPDFSTSLSDQDLNNLVAYLQTLK